MTTWNLSDLHSGKHIEKDLDRLLKQAKSLAKYKSKLSKISHKELTSLLNKFERFNSELSETLSYIHLKFSENTSDTKMLALVSRAEQTGALISNELLFFSLWWKSLPASRAKALAKDRGDITYYLDSVRKFKDFTLSEKEEQAISLKDSTGISTLMNVYNTITNDFTFKVKGKKGTFTREELTQFVYSEKPSLRKEAYTSLLSKYKKNKAVLGQVYRSRVMDWHNEQIGLRKYSKPISVRNLYNDMPDKAIRTLLDVCEKNTKVFQKFFTKKARILGVKKLRRCDIYAPLHSSSKKIPWKEAKKIVLDTFKSYSPHMMRLAKCVLDKGHVHSDVQAGKRGGAFCLSPSPRVAPFVLLSYTGQLEDVSTLAHELGHAVHGLLANKHSSFTFHPPLPLAETASIFSETMLMRRLLESTSKKQRQALLVRQLDRLYASITRQAFFVKFEIDAHEAIPQGATVDDLNKVYLSNLKTQFGSAVTIDPLFENEWMYIPHIFESPFYCYAYAFGNLLSLGLVDMLDKKGLAAMPAIESLLAWGGAKSPQEILKSLEIDMTKPDIWQSGFDVINKLVDEL